MLKILPINDNPSFRELHTTAFPLSILETNDSFSPIWLIQNFVNIAFKKEYDDVLTYICPYFWFWHCFKLKISLHYPFKNVVHKIKTYIDNEYYVFICVNEKYIPNRIYYKNTYYNHEILIFGYDDELEEFYTIAYNDKKKYEIQRVSFSDIDKAFRTDYEHFYKFYALKVKLDYDFSKFRIPYMRRRIKKYLHAINNKKGVNAYQYLYQYVKSLLDQDKEINMRSFRMMKERATVYALLPRYFKVNKSLNQLLQENVHIGEALFILGLKWNRLRNFQTKESILQFISLYKENEKNFFIEFLKQI